MRVCLLAASLSLLFASAVAGPISATLSTSALLAQDAAPVAQPAAPARLKTLDVSEYESWQMLGSSGISPDGRWISAVVSRLDGTNVMTIRNSDSPEKWETANAARATFSATSAFAAYTLNSTPKERDLAAKQKRPITPRVGLRNLVDGSERILTGVRSAQFNKPGSHLVALQVDDKAPQAPGTLLVIRLSDGRTTPISDVARFTIDPEGRYVVMVTKTAGGETSLQRLTLSNMTLTSLRFGLADIAEWDWDKKGNTLAALETSKQEGKEGNHHTVTLITGMGDEEPTVRTLDPKTLAGWTEGHRVSGGITINEAGTALGFLSQPWNAPKPPADPNATTNVEIWHTKDVIVQPLQKSMVPFEQQKGDLWVVKASDLSATRVGTAEEGASLVGDFNSAYIVDEKTHASAVKPNGHEFADLIAVDVWSGTRTKVESKMINNVGGLGLATLSPSRKGKYLAYAKGGDWWVYDFASKQSRNITKGLKDSFVEFNDDRTNPEKGMAWSAVWQADDAGLLLCTDFDIYRWDAKTGETTRLTEVREEKLRLRPLAIGLNPEDDLQASDPVYVSIFDTVGKGSGIGRIKPGGEFEPLTFDANHEVLFVGKSKDTDRILMRMESFTQSPMLLLSNTDFGAAKPVMTTNPQQKDYAWGSASLISYTDKKGTPLQGILYKPANHNPNRSYPMITIIYERMSDGLHNYLPAGVGQAYDVQHYVQNGYFVLMPDIAYQSGDPGMSAVDCLEAALKASFKADRTIDRDRVGLSGHSWGGYQAAFVATQSKMFAAYSAGAPLTEYITMSNSFYWNWGQANQVIFESSQGRMPKAWFDDVDAFIRNSPLFHAKQITKPMLIQAADGDGAVDWTQSQFLYNTLRRMGKEAILLVYPGENHNVARRANQKDYSRRISHFYDVYLKRAKPEPWLSSGVKAIDLAKEQENSSKQDPPLGG